MSENWEHRTGPFHCMQQDRKATWLPPSWRNVLQCRVRGQATRRRNKRTDDITNIYIQWRSTELVSTLVYCTYTHTHLDMRSVIIFGYPINNSQFQETTEDLVLYLAARHKQVFQKLRCMMAFTIRIFSLSLFGIQQKMQLIGWKSSYLPVQFYGSNLIKKLRISWRKTYDHITTKS